MLATAKPVALEQAELVALGSINAMQSYAGAMDIHRVAVDDGGLADDGRRGCGCELENPVRRG